MLNLDPYHSTRRVEHGYKWSAEEVLPILIEALAARINHTIHMLERFCAPFEWHTIDDHLKLKVM